MSVFIKGMGLIAPNWDCENKKFHIDPNSNLIPYLTCMEPDYKKFINPVAIRRMSKILKMGTTSAKIALNDAGLDNVDAIVLGTGFGCFSDTTVFLDAMLDNAEKQLTPTAFIQSTHNSVNSQIALMLKCNGYNYTYSHGGLSFENALTDAIMLLNDKDAENVLVGGFDEITDLMYTSMKSAGWCVGDTIFGESCGMFVLTNVESDFNYCKIDDIRTSTTEVDFGRNIFRFLEDNNLHINDLDLILEGSTDTRWLTEQKLAPDVPLFEMWKHITGESMTATVNALNFAASIIKTQQIPDELVIKGRIKSNYEKVLILNNFRNLTQSLILVSKC